MPYDTVDPLIINSWSTTLELVMQQMGSRLRSTVQERRQEGKFDFFNRIGTTEAKEKTARNEIVEYTPMEHDVRCVFTKYYYWSHLFDSEDAARVIVDPTSQYYAAAAAALGRKMDETIINAALGKALTGQNAETSVELPVTQVVPVNYKGAGGANTSLTLAKLKQVRSILGKSEAYDENSGEQLYFIYSQAELDALLGIEEAINNDYVTQQNLRDGKPVSFMGFTFIRTQLLPVASSIRSCIAYPSSAITLSMFGDLKTAVDVIPERHHARQLYAAIQPGAVRNWEEKVVKVLCDETKVV